jgi:hypothetical protein
MKLDDEIDRLYQVPLSEFTAARNELAKRAGTDAAEIRKLAKPNVAAWAVNQLYWHRRSVYDRLVDAARALRSAHGKVLAGRASDVSAAESAHRDAARAAIDEIRTILTDGGDSATSATLQAVQETLQALPADGSPGRLTRPLRPAGFEALAGLIPRSGPVLRALAKPPANEPVAHRPAKSAEKAADLTPAQAKAAAKRAAEEQRRAAARAQQELKRAKAAEEKALLSLKRAREAHARAEQERARLEDQLLFADKQIRDRAADVRRLEEAVRQAARDRERAE